MNLVWLGLRTGLGGMETEDEFWSFIEMNLFNEFVII